MSLKLKPFLTAALLVALCVSHANAELYVFIGDISGIPGQWEETLGGEWIFRPPITNYFVCACLGQEIHEHIMRRVAELSVRDDDPGFITLYGFPPCYLWVVDGNSKQVVAWHSINLKDFTTYECQTRVKVIFPDTTLCHEIGGEIICNSRP